MAREDTSLYLKDSDTMEVKNNKFKTPIRAFFINNFLKYNKINMKKDTIRICVFFFVKKGINVDSEELR